MNSVNEFQTAHPSRVPLPQRIVNFLFGAHPSISDVAKQRRVRLSANLAFVLTLTNIISLFFVGREGIDTAFYIQAGLTIVTLLAYILTEPIFSFCLGQRAPGLLPVAFVERSSVQLAWQVGKDDQSPQ